jgi:hypothetical protein
MKGIVLGTTRLAALAPLATFATFATFALIGGAAPAMADVCGVQDQPAATLLLPYFEVNLANPAGVDTVVSLNNALPNAELVHVVLWSDLSVPALDFNVYLTGFDQQVIDLRDILVNGNLPQTASTGQDPTDTISPKGIFSQDIDFASCNGILPPPPLTNALVAYLQAALTGNPGGSVVMNKCIGRNFNDHLARGFMTMDVVNNCTLRFPGDAGYFGAGGTGDATDANALFGDFSYVFQNTGAAQGFPLVHVVASSTDPQTTTAGNYTFYGRFDNWTAIDNRAPLSTNFGARYTVGGASSTATDYIAWRDPKMQQAPFACPVTGDLTPPWFPLGAEGIVMFDDQEHPNVPNTGPVSPVPLGTAITPFAAVAQRTKVNGPFLPVPFQLGWMYLDLNTSVTPAGAVPPADPLADQAWVLVITSANGKFATGFDAAHFDSACHAAHTAIPSSEH